MAGSGRGCRGGSRGRSVLEQRRERPAPDHLPSAVWHFECPSCHGLSHVQIIAAESDDTGAVSRIWPMTCSAPRHAPQTRPTSRRSLALSQRPPRGDVLHGLPRGGARRDEPPRPGAVRSRGSWGATSAWAVRDVRQGPAALRTPVELSSQRPHRRFNRPATRRTVAYSAHGQASNRRNVPDCSFLLALTPTGVLGSVKRLDLRGARSWRGQRPFPRSCSPTAPERCPRPRRGLA
jgi:hypothetical protein